MRRTHILLFCIVSFVIWCAVPSEASNAAPAAVPGSAQEGGEVHRAAPVGAYGGRMNPDVSAVVNLWALFSDDKENSLRNKVHIRETELAFQAYLYPGIRGDLIIAMHEHDGEWEVHPEEAIVSFLDLPLGFQFLAGRKLIGFGRLNPVHPHHWKFADQPLVMDNFFGDHPFFDDGAQLDWLLPNPWDLYLKLAFGRWTGGTLGAGHAHESDGEEHTHAPTLHWRGGIYNGRAALDLPFGELSNVLLGYSVVSDEGYHTVLHGGDVTLTYRHPMSYKRVKWQSEIYYAMTEDEHAIDPFGFYSMLALTWNQHWELGARYDRSEFFREAHEDAENGGEEHHHPTADDEWGVTGFLSYYFTHGLCLRLEYTHSLDRFEVTENRVIAQIVWGLGPHAHRIED
jgi:hypothetical protein